MTTGRAAVQIQLHALNWVYMQRAQARPVTVVSTAGEIGGAACFLSWTVQPAHALPAVPAVQSADASNCLHSLVIMHLERQICMRR